MNLRSFLKSHKYISRLFAVLAVAVLLACVYTGYKVYRFFVPNTYTNLVFAGQKVKEIDKFYTGVYLLPIFDLQYGKLKRDMWQFWNDDKEVVKAYCKKNYEVSVGYDNITAILSDQKLIKNACEGKTDKLPDPQILAVNPLKSTPPTRNYDANGLCYRWDANPQQRKEILMAEMHNTGILEQSNKRGRESLKMLAQVFCE